MKNTPSTQIKIYLFTKQTGKARVEDIRREFNLSRVIIHKHLNQLIKQKLLKKTGKPPVVFYLPYSKKNRSQHSLQQK